MLVTQLDYEQFLTANGLSEKCRNAQQFTALSFKAQNYVLSEAKYHCYTSVKKIAICWFIYFYATTEDGTDDERESKASVQEYLYNCGALKSQY